jgi:hypothetical protein
MTLEIIRRFENGAWGTVAAEAGGGSQPFCGAFFGHSGNISLAPNTQTQVLFDLVLYDTDGFLDTVDGGVVLIPVGLGGLYRASAIAIFDDTGTSGASWVHVELDMGIVSPPAGVYVSIVEQQATDDIGSTTVSLTSPLVPVPENQTIDMYLRCKTAVTVLGEDATTWDQLSICIERVADFPPILP